MLTRLGKRKARLISLSLMAACGCSVPFWHQDQAEHQSPDAVSQWHNAPPPGPLGPGQQAEQTLPIHQPRVLPVNEQISLMSQRLANSEDDRKVLASRLHMVETQLEEKEMALAAATREIQESTAQVVRDSKRAATMEEGDAGPARAVWQHGEGQPGDVGAGAGTRWRHVEKA